MNVREALTRVLGEVGSAPVQTELRPSEVAERVRHRRRLALAWRALSVAGAAAVVIIAAVVAPGIVPGILQDPARQPPPLAQSDRPAGTEDDPYAVQPPPEPQPRDSGASGEGRQPDAPVEPGRPEQQPGAQPPPGGPNAPAPPQQRQQQQQQPDRQPGAPDPGQQPPQQGQQRPQQQPDRQPTGSPQQNGPSIAGVPQEPGAPSQPKQRRLEQRGEAPEGGQSGTRACGEVTANGATYDVVKEGDVSCSEAREVIRQTSTGDDPSGWECQSAGSGGGITCRRGDDRVSANQTG